MHQHIHCLNPVAALERCNDAVRLVFPCNHGVAPLLCIVVVCIISLLYLGKDFRNCCLACIDLRFRLAVIGCIGVQCHIAHNTCHGIDMQASIFDIIHDCNRSLNQLCVTSPNTLCAGQPQNDHDDGQQCHHTKACHQSSTDTQLLQHTSCYLLMYLSFIFILTIPRIGSNPDGGYFESL